MPESPAAATKPWEFTACSEQGDGAKQLDSGELLHFISEIWGQK